LRWALSSSDEIVPDRLMVVEAQYCSAFFALGAALAFVVVAAARLVVVEGACGAAPEVAAGQLTVRVAVVQADLALAVAGDAPLRYEQPPARSPNTRSVSLLSTLPSL
jgi:hypothetical protein